MTPFEFNRTVTHEFNPSVSSDLQSPCLLCGLTSDNEDTLHVLPPMTPTLETTLEDVVRYRLAELKVAQVRPMSDSHTVQLPAALFDSFLAFMAGLLDAAEESPV